ncbi:MAG: HPP family protein [Candidatus Odinarchaeota archaeon]
MKVRQLMVRNIVSVTEDTPLLAIINLMLDLDLGSLIVKNRQGQLSGIITHSDILRVFSTLLHTSGEMSDGQKESNALVDNIPETRDIMSSTPITIKESDSIQKAALMMSEKSVSKLVVIGDDRKLVGIITTSDLILALGTQLVEEDIADYLTQVLRLKKVQREKGIGKEKQFVAEKQI